MGYADAERNRAAMLEWWCKKPNMAEFKRRIGRDIPMGEAFFIETAAEIGWFGDGDTYAVHPSIVKLVDDAAQTIPDLTIRPEMFKSYCGFVWLEEPCKRELYVPADDATFIVALHAISWQYVNMDRMSDERRPYAHAHPQTPDEATGVSVTYWCKPMWADVPIPAAWGTLHWGEDWGTAKARYMQEGRLIRGTAGEEQMGDNYHDFLLALLSFLESEVVITERATIGHNGTVRRIRKQTGRPPREIEVVKLRRRSLGETEAQERSSIEYDCQWFVRGHWRQQACGPRMSQRRAIWIKPYRKGPDDKPVKDGSARRIFEVVR